VHRRVAGLHAPALGVREGHRRRGAAGEHALELDAIELGLVVARADADAVGAVGARRERAVEHVEARAGDRAHRLQLGDHVLVRAIGLVAGAELDQVLAAHVRRRRRRHRLEARAQLGVEILARHLERHVSEQREQGERRHGERQEQLDQDRRARAHACASTLSASSV
jgi:hypothetical protein